MVDQKHFYQCFSKLNELEKLRCNLSICLAGAKFFILRAAANQIIDRWMAILR